MTQTVESLTAELAAMKAISRTIRTQTERLTPEARLRVVAWLKGVLEPVNTTEVAK